MPHARNKGGLKSRRGADGSSVETVSGKLVVSFTNAAATASGTYLNPQLSSFVGSQTVAGGAKLTSLAALFQYYRFTRLRWRLLPAGISAVFVAAFQPGSTITTPNYSGVVGMPCVCPAIFVNTLDQVIPATPAVYSVPRKALLEQPVKWWKCNPSSEPNDLVYQGSVFVGATIVFAQSVYLDISYTCEFKEFTAPANLPKMIDSRVVSDQVEDDDVKKEEPSSPLMSSFEQVDCGVTDQALDVVASVNVNPVSDPTVSPYVIGFKADVLRHAKALAIAERTSVSAAKRKLGLMQ